MDEEKSSKPLIGDLKFEGGSTGVVAGTIQHLNLHLPPLSNISAIDRFATVPPLPPNFIRRPGITEPILKSLMEPGTVALTAIEGMGGIGKTVVANELCHDPRIRNIFPDGILWFTIGKQSGLTPESLTRQMAEHLNLEFKIYSQAVYRSFFKGKSVLVVLDDVWTLDFIEPFRLDGGGSRLLYTTRIREIAPSLGAKNHDVSLLDEDQSRRFLAHWSGREPASLPEPQASEVLSECKGLVLGVAMVGAALNKKSAADWSRVVRNLRKARLEDTGAPLANYAYRTLFASIAASVEELSQAERDRYLGLAILLEDMSASALLLQQIWGGDLDDVETAKNRLVDLSLASLDPDGGLRLHDLQLDYVHARFADRAALELIHSAMHLSSYIFRSDASQFASQLTGRLLPHAGRPAIDRFLKETANNTPRPWLRPLFPALIAPGGPLICTLDVGHISELAASPDPHRVLLAGGNGLTTLDVDTFRNFARKDCGPLSTVVWHPGSESAFYAVAGEVRCFEPLTGTKRWSLPADSVIGLDANRDGDRLILHMRDSIRVWDLRESRELFVCPSRDTRFGPRSVEPVAITPDGSFAIFPRVNEVSDISDRRIEIVVVDIATGEDRFILSGHTDRISALRVSVDGRLLISASEDLSICCWSLDTGQRQQSLLGHRDWILCAAISPDGRWVASGAYDQSVRLWDLEGGNEPLILGAHSDPVSSVTFNADGSRVISHAREGTLKIWNLENKAFTLPDTHAGFVKGVAFADPDRCISASSDKTVKVWSRSTGQVIRTIAANVDRIATLCLTADGRHAITGADDGTVRVLDLDGEKEVSKLDHGTAVGDVAVSSDGVRLAFSGQSIFVWDIQTGNMIASFGSRGRFERGLAFSRDGGLIFAGMKEGTHNFVGVWEIHPDSSSATLTRRLGRHEISIDSLAVSPNGSRLVSGDYEGVVKIFDLASGAELLSWQAHQTGIPALAFSPDGAQFVSASGDCTLKVWDVRTGSPIAAFTFDRSGRCCTYGKDGMIAGGDKSGRVYFLQLEK